MGVVSSIGMDLESFGRGLAAGKCGVVQLDPKSGSASEIQVGAVLREFAFEQWHSTLPGEVRSFFASSRKILNNTTESTRWSACAAMQAFTNAGLQSQRSPDDALGLIIAGSNLSQEYVAQNWSRSIERAGRINPKYALSFWDSNQVGCLSEILGARGPGCTVGAASASGNAGLFQACQWIRSGVVDRCVVVGAGSEFSRLELDAFAMIGAACHGRFQNDPERACRPFDAAAEGFVFGQGSGAVVLESRLSVESRGARVLGEIAGISLLLDGHHLPDPSVAGEARAMQTALRDAGISPEEIAYINAHGSSSPLGDRTECDAIKQAFGAGSRQVWINSTKGLTGHCMAASGVMELIATILQLNGGFIHPNRNLEAPIDAELRFASGAALPCDGVYAMSNGFGFGGFNSSLVIRKAEDERRD